MPNFSVYEGTVGTTQIGSIGVVDSSPRMQPGALLQAVDNWWGCGEFIYARANGTITQYALCVLTPVFDSTLSAWRWDMTEVPNTANLGRDLYVAMNAMTSGNYSWFCCSGITPVKCSASVAADATFGIAAAGQGGANSAGKQILNARVVAPGSTAVAKTNCQGVSGATTITVPNSDGWFVGGYLSGTGVGASAVISAISADGRTVTVSVANSAAISGTVTCTYNNATIFYNVARINRPFAQGAIT